MINTTTQAANQVSVLTVIIKVHEGGLTCTGSPVTCTETSKVWILNGIKTYLQSPHGGGLSPWTDQDNLILHVGAHYKARALTTRPPCGPHWYFRFEWSLVKGCFFVRSFFCHVTLTCPVTVWVLRNIIPSLSLITTQKRKSAHTETNLPQVHKHTNDQMTV